MTLREKVAMAIAKAEIEYFGPRSTLVQCQSWVLEPDCYRNAADAAIALVLEEAAKVCQQLGRVHREKGNIPGTWSFVGCEDCAAAIRALKENPDAEV